MRQKHRLVKLAMGLVEASPLSVREIEKRAGLSQGSIKYWFVDGTRGDVRVPNLDAVLGVFGCRLGVVRKEQEK